LTTSRLLMRALFMRALIFSVSHFYCWQSISQIAINFLLLWRHNSLLDEIYFFIPLFLIYCISLFFSSCSLFFLFSFSYFFFDTCVAVILPLLLFYFFVTVYFYLLFACCLISKTGLKASRRNGFSMSWSLKKECRPVKLV